MGILSINPRRMKSIFFVAFLLCASPLLVRAQPDSVPGVASLLNLSLEELMNITVVTATGSAQTINEAPSTMNVITSRQIRERGYEQLEDALRDIPGIDFIHTYGYIPTLIYFRGMYGAENLRALLMIDGIPENNIIGSNDMAGPAYSLHNVERIEVIWGPASALYGTNAFGGVINIITRKGSDLNGFQYQKGFGTFNTSVNRARFGIHKNNWDISISGSLYSTDGPKFKNRDPNYSASYVDKAYSVNTIISYDFKKMKLTLGGRIYNTPMGWGTFLNSPTVFLRLPPQGYGNSGILGLVARDVRGEKSGLEEPYSRTFYVQNEYKPSEKFNILARFVYRETGISERSYAYITLDGRKLYRVPTASYSNRVLGEVMSNYNLGKQFTLSAGIQFYQDNIEHGSRGINVDSTTVYLLDGRDTLLNLNATFKPRLYDIRNTFGSYAQFVWNTKLLKKTSFTLGARYDNNTYYGNPLSPRVAIVSQPTDKFTFKLLFGTAFRAPTNTEIYQAPAGFTLKTEKIRTYEMNLIYRLTPAVLAQLNSFRNELRDVIVLNNLGSQQPDKNPGKININGLEAKLDLSMNGFNGFVNFTYQHAVGENYLTGIKRNTPGIARVKGNLGGTLHVRELFNLNLTGNWVGKRQVPITDPYGPVKGYFLTNMTLSTERLFDRRISASISVRNLFNTTYLDPGFRAADGFIYSTVLEQPGINGLLKFMLTL